LRRCSTLVPGALQSVGSIGSHTANTSISLFGYFLKIVSTAEAPRRHVGHVGESRRITRRLLVARLNSDFNMPSAELFIWTKGD
jgi:hypothetical protein